MIFRVPYQKEKNGSLIISLCCLSVCQYFLFRESVKVSSSNINRILRSTVSEVVKKFNPLEKKYGRYSAKNAYIDPSEGIKTHSAFPFDLELWNLTTNIVIGNKCRENLNKVYICNEILKNMICIFIVVRNFILKLLGLKGLLYKRAWCTHAKCFIYFLSLFIILYWKI